jgi:hypothetical protein
LGGDRSGEDGSGGDRSGKNRLVGDRLVRNGSVAKNVAADHPSFNWFDLVTPHNSGQGGKLKKPYGAGK